MGAVKASAFRLLCAHLTVAHVGECGAVQVIERVRIGPTYVKVEARAVLRLRLG